METLLLVGIAIVAGLLGGKISNRLKFPAVAGYIVMGLMLGPSLFGIFKLDILDKMGLVSDLALGFIAFAIGSQLRRGLLRKMGRGITAIVFAESFGAFIVVTLATYLLTRKLHVALIFGAMAPASAPAGTVVVLQEYRAKGPLTNALLAVVGFDDALAIMIYAFAAAGAKLILSGGSQFSLSTAVGAPVVAIVGAILLGALVGLAFAALARRVRGRNEILIASVGAILMTTGLANHLHLSLILANLTLGMIVSNTFLRLGRRSFEAVQTITPPIYVLFFVLAGAHLQVPLLLKMGLLGVIYIVSRIAGLMGGSFFGAALTRAAPSIRRYLGLGILSQAGVAIGLALLVAKEFGGLGDVGHNLSILTINTVAATTIFFEILGPLTTKIAITKAGEIGRAKG